MIGCDEYCVQLTLYLDGELDVDEKNALEAHLKVCQTCSNRLKRERRFVGHLQRSAPLYAAPDEVRHRIESIVDKAQPTSTPGRADEPRQVQPSPTNGIGSFIGKRFKFNVAAAFAALLVVTGLWGVAQLINPAQSLTFASIAVDTHQRHTLGRLPLELTSDSPERISRWFDGKVPFSLKLPNYQEISGQEKLYSLKGARLIGFKNDYAAYVAYDMGEHPISLVVTSSADTKPEGGEQITSKGLVFHYETISGLKVITWSHRGLTYALVSDLEERGQQSCLVCHQGLKDENLFSSLDPTSLTASEE